MQKFLFNVEKLHRPYTPQAPFCFCSVYERLVILAFRGFFLIFTIYGTFACQWRTWQLLQRIACLIMAAILKSIIKSSESLERVYRNQYPLFFYMVSHNVTLVLHNYKGKIKAEKSHNKI